MKQSLLRRRCDSGKHTPPLSETRTLSFSFMSSAEAETENRRRSVSACRWSPVGGCPDQLAEERPGEGRPFCGGAGAALPDSGRPRQVAADAEPSPLRRAWQSLGAGVRRTLSRLPEGRFPSCWLQGHGNLVTDLVPSPPPFLEGVASGKGGGRRRRTDGRGESEREALPVGGERR